MYLAVGLPSVLTGLYPSLCWILSPSKTENSAGWFYLLASVRQIFPFVPQTKMFLPLGRENYLDIRSWSCPGKSSPAICCQFKDKNIRTKPSHSNLIQSYAILTSLCQQCGDSLPHSISKWWAAMMRKWARYRLILKGAAHQRTIQIHTFEI